MIEKKETRNPMPIQVIEVNLPSGVLCKHKCIPRKCLNDWTGNTRVWGWSGRHRRAHLSVKSREEKHQCTADYLTRKKKPVTICKMTPTNPPPPPFSLDGFSAQKQHRSKWTFLSGSKRDCSLAFLNHEDAGKFTVDRMRRHRGK